MLLTRKLEERLVNLYRQNQVVGGLYRSLGQEAETIGAVYALEKEDVIAPLIRNMGAVLVKGYRARDVAMQYMARANGPSRGKDLNIHFGEVPEPGVVSPISMLGELIPVMTGVALAFKLRKQSNVALAFIGDGGSSTGAFYEGMNFASVQRLPLVVVIEDNAYAYSTPIEKQTAARTLADKAYAFGCSAETVDGNDVFAVHRAAKRAIDNARAGGGVTLLEVKTFRMKGHAEHDNQSYVPVEIIDEWRGRDPIERYEQTLIENKIATAEDFEEMQKRVRAEVDEATDEAERAPMPRGEEAARGLFAGDGYWDA